MLIPWMTIIMLFIMMTLLDRTYCARLPDVYWNSSNPIFRIDNTDHIIDVNKGNVAYEYDQVNLICPMYSRGTREEDVESYIIYNVSKEEYDTCRIVNQNQARTIAVCDSPFKNRYFTITFRPFTPQPGGLEFRPGQDYYFISLSPKSGGMSCNTHHMKIAFKVCCKNNNKLSPPSRTTTLSPPILSSNGSHINMSNFNQITNFTSTRPPKLGTTSRIPSGVVHPIIHTNSGADDLLQNNVSSNRVHSLDTNINTRLRNKNNHHNHNKPHESQSHSHHNHNHNNHPHLPSSNSHNNSKVSSSGVASPPSIMLISPSSSPSSPPIPSSSTPPTPYWWRPHFTKLPSLKHAYDVPRSDQGWSTKKKSDRDKLPNETRAKNSELINGSQSRINCGSCLTLQVIMFVTSVIVTMSVTKCPLTGS